jgi:predicted NBD/HSP70 family sugar kinase
VRPFEEALASELAGLLHAGVPARGVRLTVRELLVARFERGPLGAREVGDAVEAAVRAACRMVREMDAPDEVVDTVCRAALEAVRGHGGESARWLAEATNVTTAVLDELARERAPDPMWSWLARRSRW